MSNPTSQTNHASWALSSYRYVPLLLVACIGIALSAFLFGIVRGWEQRRIKTDFQRAGEIWVSDLTRAFDHHLLELEALGAFYAGSQEVTRREFHTFVKPFLARYRGIQALEWIPRVPDAQRAAYEEAAREDGFTEFQITERNAQEEIVRAAPRKEYFPVYYVEPYAGNETALGFDLASNPARLEALNRSRDTGEMVASARITLVQETGHQFGFLIFVPIYQKDAPTDSVEARRKNLVGFGLAVFRIGDVVNETLAYKEPAGIDMYIFDASAPVGERFLHFHSSRTRTVPAVPTHDEAALHVGMHYRATLDVAGRKWFVLCKPAPEFLAARRTWQPWITLAGGLLLTGVLTAYILLILTGAARTRQFAAEQARAKQELEREIIERKRAQEVLRESEKKFHTITRSALDAIIMMDGGGNIAYWNPAAQKMFGYSSDEIIGKDVHEALAPRKYHEAYKKGIEGFRNTGKGPAVGKTIELTALRKDGSEFPMEISVSSIMVKGSWWAVAIIRDITERKQAEEALQKRTYDLGERIKELNCLYGISKLVEKEGISLAEILQGLVDLIPPAWQYPEITCARVILEDQEFRPENFRETIWKQASDIIVHGNRIGTLDVYYLEEKPQSDEGPFLKEERNLINAITERLGRITERKQADEQIQRYAAELEHANEELRTFTYAVSHDLRAPLVNMRGFAAELRFALELIGPSMNAALPHLDERQRQAITKALKEDVPEALDFIDSSAIRMDRSINALLKLSRLGRRELKLESIDMNALVQATLQTLAHQIEERHVKVTVRHLPEMVADRTSMEQTMGNILDNGVKYLEPGRPGEIEITAERSDDETTFRVRDNGCGIAKEDMDKVFAPFRRAGRQDVPGEGMGLLYVQTLVRRHGGRIWCESELGVGTTFTFTISNDLEKGGEHV